MAELLAILLLYLAGAAVVYGVWRGRRSSMASVNGRFTLRGWHVAMWLAVSCWLSAMLLAAMEKAEPAALVAVAVVPAVALLAIGHRLHRR